MIAQWCCLICKSYDFLLGKMYVADERFKKNIDKNGAGTAEFAAEGIRIYVENK